MGEAPDLREQEDCPSMEACDQSCDQHEKDVTCVWTNCTIAAPHEHRGYLPVGAIPPDPTSSQEADHG